MKEVLVDINELTDSREMYHSKPHPFVWIFTYILIGLVVTAVIWAAFGKKEIVVKAPGQVRPESGISTVRNIVGGELKSTCLKQGMKVKAGDILYIIKHDNLLMERESAEEKFKELEKELENLKKYRNCITTKENNFDSINEPVYYEKVRKLLMDIRFSQTDTAYKTTRLSEEKILNSAQLTKNLKEIEYLKKYIKSLDNNKNYFNSGNELEKQYKQKYDKYLIAKTEIQRKYDQQANEIKSNSLDAMKQSLEEEKSQLKAYETLKKSVSEAKNNFPSGDRYSYLYTDYENKLNLLKNTYDEKKRIYEAYLSLSGIAITKSELEDARVQMQNSQGEYTSYKSKFLYELEKNINNTEISIKEKESKISGTQGKQGLLDLNEKDRKNSLKALYLQERNDAAQAIDSLTDTIETLRQKNVLSDAELKTITDADGNNNDSLNYSLVERTKVQEVVAADEKIRTITDSITGVKENIKKLQLSINNAIVKASVNGEVNIITEMYPGDLVAAGAEILTIIPDTNTAFKMQITVSNKDIGEIHTGDTVKYSFAALPYREYGQAAGKITSISKDAVNNAEGQSYYTVEATVPVTKMIGSSGKQGEIKTGMICEANVITKQKSFLRYLLEKINLLD
ncbi:HlyD family efflux transporter periplasmic adaptor subunit [Ruminiclostridium papyrosolvens]|uniref:Uncharacterized protein n=1 Tax=Ruminiclostridium papyrosolvens C7 TaxID=1330534 RepID=U4R1F2_9FIRM|nr:HlyD family efflux transporter periplasmic adaptor subunit [Ruminiclostridium papyrosolvens]EPR12006.1 hypothetical protein L323_10310 [Ruminiclostridium papyrosolvens C7]